MEAPPEERTISAAPACRASVLLFHAAPTNRARGTNRAAAMSNASERFNDVVVVFIYWRDQQ
jgi:hypothetical protein